MGKYQNILLDLDGTIIDSGPGIMKSVQYALNHFSLYHQPEEKLRRFIGPSLTDSFMKVYKFNAKQAEEALSYYREFYPSEGMFDASLYPGMEECIKTLAEQGKKVILLTAKSRRLYVRDVYIRKNVLWSEIQTMILMPQKSWEWILWLHCMATVFRKKLQVQIIAFKNLWTYYLLFKKT